MIKLNIEIMRIFIAIELPISLRKKLSNLIFQLKNKFNGKWVEENNWHLTVVFIGEIPTYILNDFKKMLTKVLTNWQTFNLETHQFEFIPKRQPKIIALTIKSSSEFTRLQQNLSAQIKSMKLSAIARPAHITLVRLKQPQSANDLPQLKPFKYKIPVQTISLMQSTLTPQGPIYKRLMALNLRFTAHKSRFRPNIAICIINPKNEILLIRSSEHNPKDWQFPQGGIEKGESLAQAARREVLEEVGLKNIKLLIIKERIYKYRWSKDFLRQLKRLNPDGYIGQEQSLAVASVNEIRPKINQNPREASYYKWVHYTKLLEHISPVRRDLGRLAMVELKKIISSVNQ